MKVLATLTFVFCTLGTPAFATDECADVLAKSQLKDTDFTSHDFYFQHQIWSSSFAKNESEDLSLSVVLYGVPVTLGDKKNIQTKLSQFSDTTTVRSHDEHLVLYNLRAESEALKEWGNCMSNNAGVRARFEPQADDPTGKNVALVIEYFAQALSNGSKQETLYLTSDAIRTIPKDVTYYDPVGCLKKGHKYLVGDRNCKIDMIASRRTNFSITLTLSDKDGTHNTRADAYLPPRPRLIPEIKNWPAEVVVFDRPYGAQDTKCTSIYPGTACAVAATLNEGVNGPLVFRDADPGYIFLEKTIDSRATQYHDPNAACSPPASLVPTSLGTQISLGATTGRMDTGKGEYHSALCNASAKEIKFNWVWDD